MSVSGTTGLSGPSGGTDPRPSSIRFVPSDSRATVKSPRCTVASRRPRASSAKSNSSNRISFSASRLEMMQNGVPDDYIDALLDEDYMERLIVANDHLNRKRRFRLQRYLFMNQIIFVFLLVQAILGVSVTIFKMFIVPDTLFSGKGTMENVELMVMMDTADHMKLAMDQQQKSVAEFSQKLNQAMKDHRVNTISKVKAKVEKKQDEKLNEQFLVRWFPFLKYLSLSSSTPVEISGGQLRIATSIFNAKEVRRLHGFTPELSEQKVALEKLNANKDYQSSGQWLGALHSCKEMVEKSGTNKSKAFCVIIGDNEALCRKHVSAEVLDICESWGDTGLCPEDLKETGNMMEYPEEVKECTDFVQHNFVDVKNSHGGSTTIKTIMMFTVKSYKEEQQRLKSPAFREFLKDIADCGIKMYTDEDDKDKTVYELEKSCNRFMMANNFEILAQKSEKVAQELKSTPDFFEEDTGKDARYWFFLLLPLNLVFYIIWSKILRCTAAVSKKVDSVRGVKKKMIKVTKTLVEKNRRDSMVELFEANLTEVEMAEVSTLRPAVQCGSTMTLRARLKGGYLHQSGNACDGNGKAFDDQSNWSFEPVDSNQMPGGSLQGGQRVMIKSGNGKFLRLDENGSSLVDAKRRNGVLGAISEDGVEAGGDDAQEFIVEALEYENGDEHADTRLGDAVRIKCCATGKYIRVHKDGRVDGLGNHSDTETQMHVDLGGKCVASSSVISLKSVATGAFMFGDCEGNLSACPGGDTWKYWQLEKKAHTTDGGDEGAEGAQGSGEPGDLISAVHNLKVGDVVSLKGINQNMLEVAQDGVTCHCGRLPPKPEDPDNPDAGEPEEKSGSGCQEFIVERVGMGIVEKHDKTLRTGAQIALRPLFQGKPRQNTVESTNYLNVDGSGCVAADGRVTSSAIGFIIEIATMSDMVVPISDHLLKGDMELMISPLWNKHEVKRLEALSAPWTTNDDLSRFKGAVVVASASGQYTVPKAKGDSFQGWVAVIKDGVDIVKAAKQAKAQGATGIIIKTSEVLSMEKLARSYDEVVPELPAVYMDEHVAMELNERGINLKGCEFKGINRTAALRSIGKAGTACQRYSVDPATATAQSTADVFKNVGALMKEKADEEAEVAALRPSVMEHQGDYEEDEDDDAGNGFQWKVASNTHYLWSSSQGGKMNVNFGKKAPPSAARKQKIDIATGRVNIDASQSHVVAEVKKKKQLFEMDSMDSTVVGVTLVDSDDFKNQRVGFAEDFAEVLTPEQASAPMEQLPDDSDFKIMYEFAEVEVEAGDKAEEMMEEELIDDSGAVVGQFTVPASQFWLVATGMIVSTIVLCGMLYYMLATSGQTQARGQVSLSDSSTFLNANDFDNHVDMADAVIRKLRGQMQAASM